jgi:hypothetical protein
LSARDSGSASESTPLLPDEYEQLIEHVRETADAMIPRNATVLVVSRGDEELLRIGPRRALHFPQDEFGRYAGYHPSDSDAAIALLEDMRTRGGEYLLLPSTAFWWLDYYQGLQDHLDRNYQSIVSTDECMIFELTTAGVQTPAAGADTRKVSAATSSRQLAGPLDELLRALLPESAIVAVVAAGESELPMFGDCRAVRPPDAGGLPALLAEAAASGADFLVIPEAAFDRVHGGREAADVSDGWRIVTRQEHLCEIYERELGTRPAAGGRRPADGDSTASIRADGGPPAAGPSLWQRFLNWFRGS